MIRRDPNRHQNKKKTGCGECMKDFAPCIACLCCIPTTIFLMFSGNADNLECGGCYSAGFCCEKKEPNTPRQGNNVAGKARDITVDGVPADEAKDGKETDDAKLDM